MPNWSTTLQWTPALTITLTQVFMSVFVCMNWQIYSISVYVSFHTGVTSPRTAPNAPMSLLNDL